MIVTKVAEQEVRGKDVPAYACGRRATQRTIYHMIYQAGARGPPS
jgi:hypothetical protein